MGARNQRRGTVRSLSAEEVSAQFRRNPENERLYRESEIRIEFSERMKAMRKESGFSQVELADKLGCSQSFIAKLERGGYDRSGLSTLRTFALAMGYDINVDRMFERASGKPIAQKAKALGYSQKTAKRRVVRLRDAS
jgi:transcriptional regulator with XRE-family HTH domain